jgi:glutamate dehydrogenase
MRRQTFRLARKARSQKSVRPIDATIESYRPGVEALIALGTAQAFGREGERLEAARRHYQEIGTPPDLAADVASLRVLLPALDVVELAERTGQPMAAVSLVFHGLGYRLGFDDLRAAARELVSTEHWDRLAVRRMAEESYAQQLVAAEAALSAAAPPPQAPLSAVVDWAVQAVDDLLVRYQAQAAHARNALEQLEKTGPWSFAKLTIASAQMHELVDSMR